MRNRTGETRRPRPLPHWVTPFLPFLTALAAAGLILSAWIHLGAVMGRQVAPLGLFIALHAGILVVWIPAVAVARTYRGRVTPRDSWRMLLPDSPAWVCLAVYALLLYAFFNFAVFLAAPARLAENLSASPAAAAWRGFSGHWMAFYAAAWAILYSGLQRSRGR